MCSTLRCLLFFLTVLSTDVFAFAASIKGEQFFYKKSKSEGLYDLHFTHEESLDKDNKFQMDLKLNHWQGPKGHRTYIYPERFFVSSKDKNVTVYLGTKEIQLSYIEAFSPTQFYQTNDMTQPLKSQVFNPLVIGAKSKHQYGSFEFYYMPIRKRTMVPHESSPWLPQQTLNTSEYVLYIPEDVHYSIAGIRGGTNVDKNNIIVAGSINVEALDWRVFYYNGISSSPEITPQLSGQILQAANPTIIRADRDITLHLNDPRTESLGSAMQMVFGKNIFRLENAWNRRYYLKGKREEQENAVQWERLIGFLNHGMGGIQVSYLWNNSDLLASPSPFSVRQVINRSILVAAKIIWKERHDFSAYHLASTMNSSNYLIGAQYKYSFKDNWSVWAGGQLLDGKGQNIFNSYREMANISAGLEWKM